MNIPIAHVERIRELGYTDAEARFLYIVAVFSGYFTLGHFRAFTGSAYGKRSTSFAQKLLKQGHATEGQEALVMLKRFLKGPQTQTSFVFRSKRGTALRETSVLHSFLHPVLRTLGFPQAGMHAFRHGCNRRWELSGMNPAVLRQQMGHSSAVMTARYTGEIPLDKVQEAFSKMELENMEVIGKRPRYTGSRLVVYNQQTRGSSGRRTMAV